MKTFKIAHLYYDLMNLYGENGNIRYLKNRLEEKDIVVEITDSAKEIIVKEGYDPIYGARPLKRYISNTLETMIAKKLIAGEIYNGCTIVIDGENDNIDIYIK